MGPVTSVSGVNRTLINLDLNLLVSLDALLRERNVTRAARYLGLSQPAVSSSLRKLRRHFGDELLIRVGNTHELTPLAIQLNEQTAAALGAVQRVFDAVPVFDPMTSEREFTLMMSDYCTIVFGEAISKELHRRAPGIVLRLEPNTRYAVDHASEYLRQIDGLVIPHGFVTEIPWVDLYEDGWVCLVDRDNPAVGDQLTMELLATLPWILTFHAPTAYSPAAHQLRMIGVEPRVSMVVESFMPVPFLVAGTDRIALVQRRLAAMLAPVAGVRVLECPFDAVPLAEALWWHPVYRADPAHRWLRQTLVEVARSLPAADVITALS
jgi:DNA-binding transcriptional LysR family regulator